MSSAAFLTELGHRLTLNFDEARAVAFHASSPVEGRILKIVNASMWLHVTSSCHRKP